MVSSTLGSPTKTIWKRRSRAASFSMYLRYSFSVVAPMARRSPRASGGLSMLRGVHGALGGSCADQRVQLVDEEDDLAVRVLDLLEQGLEAVFELAAILGSGEHDGQVEGDDALVLQNLRHVAVHDAAGESFDDGGLADAGLADEHGVVLGAAREHLDDAANLFVAADDGIELAATGEVGQVLCIFLERLKLGLGILVGDALRSADSGKALEDGIVRGSERSQQKLRAVVLLLGEREQ